MNSPFPHSRRRFLGTSLATAAGGALCAGVIRLHAEASGETEHFHYRLAPADGPYIDSQRDNLAFGFRDGHIFLSEDNGKTWPKSAAFPEAENITFSCFLKNGNILFATRAKLFLSTDTWKEYDLAEFGPRSPVRFHRKNREGWFRMDLRKGWIERGEVLFIKPKESPL